MKTKGRVGQAPTGEMAGHEVAKDLHVRIGGNPDAVDVAVGHDTENPLEACHGRGNGRNKIRG